jgi:hypothetical protein
MGTVIIAMSALFEQDVSHLSNPISLERTLELRQIPHLRLISDMYPPTLDSQWGYTYVGATLGELFKNLSTNWMYTAEIQLTMDGAEPAWSKDGWNFVPIDLSHLENKTRAEDSSGLDTKFNEVSYSHINVTLRTPAIRGRVECTSIKEVNDTRTWLTTLEFPDPQKNSTRNFTMPLGHMFAETQYDTALAPDGQFLSCCLNQTESTCINSLSMPIALGYWTNNWDVANKSTSVTGVNNEFIVKCESQMGDYRLLFSYNH